MTRILVVDDETLLRRRVSGLLKGAGYDIFEAEDGQAALAEVHRCNPNLVLVDFVMPKMNGFQFCAALRTIANHKDTPIVLLSARTNRIADNFIKRFRVNDALSKPFEDEALLAVITKVLGDRKIGKKDGFESAPLDGALPADYPSKLDPLIVVAERLAALVFSSLDEVNGDRRKAIDEIVNQLNQGVPTVGSELIADLEQTPMSAALSGNLKEVPLTDVMQLLAMQRSDGILDVSNNHAMARIQFGEGAVYGAVATGIRPEFLLGRYLVEEEMVSRQDLDLLLSKRKGSNLFGEQLVKLGYINKDELAKVLRRQTSEIMIEVLRWEEGRFRFNPNWKIPGAAQFINRLDVANLVMEGFRQVDEWRLIEREIPNFSSVLVPAGDRGSLFDRDELSSEESFVLDHVDGKRNVRDIIDSTAMGSFAAGKILYRLLSVKLIQRRTDQ